MADLTALFGGAYKPPDLWSLSPEDQLRHAMEAAGIDSPEVIYLDGQLHRFHSSPNAKEKNGYYAAHGDNIPAGVFGCWKQNVHESWRSKLNRKLTPFEEITCSKRIAEAKAARDETQAKRHESVSKTVEAIWDSCESVIAHAYLERKRIKSHGAKVTTDNALIAPLFDEHGEFSSLQYIYADGTKRFHPGGSVAHKFWSLGTPGSIIYIAEGFATAATINEQTGHAVFIAYSANNIGNVTAIVKKLHPEKSIVIVADNDESHTGEKAAKEAAQHHGVRYVMPPEIGDANDYVLAGGDLRSLLGLDQTALEKLDVIFAPELQKQFEVPDELIEGLLIRNEISILYGDSNSGKTFLAIHMACAIARGVEWLGRKTEPGLVLYLATESPATVRLRVQAYEHYNQCDVGYGFAIVQAPVNFHNSAEDVLMVIQAIKEAEERTGLKTQMIVIDTLARVSAGANENSGEDMGAIMERMDMLKNSANAHLTIIHHAGKNQSAGARGWSGMRAHVDTELEVEEKDNIRKVKITKQRGLPGKNEEIFFDLAIIQTGKTKWGKDASTCVVIDAQEQTTKIESKLVQYFKTFTNAWVCNNYIVNLGYPYLSKNQLKDYLINKHGYAEQTAKNYCNPTDTRYLVGMLLNSCIIESYAEGWRVIAEPYKSQMMILAGSNGSVL